MTAPQPAARPYRVHLEVLAFTGSFWTPKATIQRWADLALTAQQAETLSGSPDQQEIFSYLDFPMLLVLSGWIVGTGTLAVMCFIPGVGAAVPAAAWALGTGALSLTLGRRWRFLGRARHRIERTLDAAVAAGAVYRVGLQDQHWSRLHRIDTALTILQAHAGSTFDDQARAAVTAVITPPPPPAREPDTAPKGTSPKARYRAALHGIFTELLQPPKPSQAVDPVAALEAEAARFRAG